MSAPETLIQTIWQDIQAVRDKAPLIVNITNYVVTNNTANSLLALGASPAMSHVAEDLPGLVNLAGALVVNLGTLADDYVVGMHTAMAKANDMGLPIVLDPVAAGVNALRTDLPREFLRKYRPAILRETPRRSWPWPARTAKPRAWTPSWAWTRPKARPGP